MELPTPNSILRGEQGSRTSWAVAAYTGSKLHKGGKHTPMRMLDLALGWRIWTAVLMWWIGMWVLSTGFFMYNHFHQAITITAMVGFAVLIYLAMGLTYIRLAAQSDFNIRGPFKPLWRWALYVPNVAPMWFYTSPFLLLLMGMSVVNLLPVAR